MNTSTSTQPRRNGIVFVRRVNAHNSASKCCRLSDGKVVNLKSSISLAGGDTDEDASESNVL